MADYGVAVDKVTGLDVRFARAPAAWQEMWAEVRHHLDIVRGWYSGGQGMNVTELRTASVAFFVSCYHLTDHIEKDLAVPQPVRHQVRRNSTTTPASSWQPTSPTPTSTASGARGNGPAASPRPRSTLPGQ